jgi:hypothetical protein
MVICISHSAFVAVTETKFVPKGEFIGYVTATHRGERRVQAWLDGGAQIRPGQASVSWLHSPLCWLFHLGGPLVTSDRSGCCLLITAPGSGTLFKSLWAAITKNHTQGDLNNRDLF